MSYSQPPPPYSQAQDPNAVPQTFVPQHPNAYSQAPDPKQPGNYGQPGYPAPLAYTNPGPGPYIAQPGQAGVSTCTIVTQPHVIVAQAYRETPVRTICSLCHTDIVTSTKYETGMVTWVACGAVCILGFDLGCCLIPFFLDACKDCVHTCPNCQHQLGRWNRL